MDVFWRVGKYVLHGEKKQQNLNYLWGYLENCTRDKD